MNSDLESVQSDTLLVVADAGRLLLFQTQVHSILNAVARPRYFEHELGVFQQRLIEDEVVVSTQIKLKGRVYACDAGKCMGNAQCT